MLNVKIKNIETGKTIKTKLPLNWEEVTIGMFCRLMDNYRETETPSNFDVIAALLNVPVQWVRDATVDSLDANIFYYIGFLAEENRWDEMWKADAPKEFKIGDVECTLVQDIGAVMTLGQKEEIMKAMADNSMPMLDKVKIIFGVFYSKVDSLMLSNAAAIGVFPVVAFFLRRLKIMLITGAAFSGNLQAMRKQLQG